MITEQMIGVFLHLTPTASSTLRAEEEEKET